jgi:hypothetical protein
LVRLSHLHRARPERELLLASVDHMTLAPDRTWSDVLAFELFLARTSSPTLEKSFFFHSLFHAKND